MKLTFNWLGQYVDCHASADELAEQLTMLGLEVERIEKVAGELEGIVVAQILSSEKHPNADKLSVCRVADGKGERQIVCGAKNYKIGDKVPLALPGAVLPAAAGSPPFTIKAAKMRGVESQGMMCSAKELQLSEDAEGLLILSADARVGQPMAEHLGRSASDAVYDLEITPNRPDWNSVIGIAREISALTGSPLRLPEINISPLETGEPVDALATVRVDAPDLCPRYTARVIRNVKVGPSPDWLRQTLEKVGLRSINNVVDVTNFVMLETGQPLHAFDYHLLSRSSSANQPTVVIRRARAGEKFVTLDGQERLLHANTLLIADEQKAIGIAGVMGGQNTEIQPQTKDVLIESAYFKPQNIRATSKALDLRTDASYRFERGGDIGVCDWASRRAAQLIVQTAGGQLAPGVIDAYPETALTREISLRPSQTNRLLGHEIPSETQLNILQRLALTIVSQTSHADGPSFRVAIPTFRVDLKREVDLIEEIARLYGVDKIPAARPAGAVGAHSFDAVYDELSDARRILLGLGLNEAQGQTLVPDQAAKLAAANIPLAPSSKTSGQQILELARLANPLSSDMNVLRPSLLPGLLDSLRHNLTRKVNEVALFEIGKVFLSSGTEFREERRLGLAITGTRHPHAWSAAEREPKSDIYDLKGALDEFFEQFGVRSIAYVRRADPTPLYLESATLQLGKQTIGEIGQLQPRLAKEYDLRDAVLLAELNLDLLLARRSPQKSFQPLPSFPAIRRDIAMFVPESTTHESVVQTIKQSKPAQLESVELFDVFRGKNIPPNQKSLAYALTYRHPERTLTDEEVNATHEKVVAELRQKLNAAIRDAG